MIVLSREKMNKRIIEVGGWAGDQVVQVGGKVECPSTRHILQLGT